MSNFKDIVQRGRFAPSPDTLTNETSGGTTIRSSLPNVADLDQFKVTVQMESGQWRLRVNKGVVTYYQSVFDDVGFNGTTSSEVCRVMTDYNIYPSGRKTTGASGTESQGIEQDGYIHIDSGVNYFVFVYCITPNWSSGGSSAEVGIPQLVVCKESDDPNYIYYNWDNGGGYIDILHEQTINNTDIDTPSGTINVPLETNFFRQVVRNVDCARHNIAHVIWDAAKGWQVRQLQYGPMSLQSQPQPGRVINYQIIDGVDPGNPWVWDPSTFAPYATTLGSISGYSKVITTTGMYAPQNVAPTGTRYLKPT